MTMKDVAKRAGVSIATVSNYLNKTKPVSYEKARRIASAIEELSFIPNLSARYVKTGKTKRFGLILPNIQDSYYAQIYEGMNLALSERGYYLSLGLTKDLPELEEACVKKLLEERVCAIAIVSAQPMNTRFFDEITKAGLALVLAIDRRIASKDVSFIGFDYGKSVYGMTKLLLNDNKKNIAIMAGPQSFSSENDSVCGFKKAYSELGLGFDESNIIISRMNKESSFRNMVRYLKNAKPDAIITTSKLSTLGVMEALSINGLRFPDDIILATFGEDSWNRFYTYQNVISTARAASKLCGEAAKILIEQADNPKGSKYSVFLHDSRVDDFKAPMIEKENMRLKALMLKTPQVELFSGLLPRFRQLTGIDVAITQVSHDNLYKRIEQDDEHDIIMFDLPWLYSLAYSGILADITDNFAKYVNPDEYLNNCLDVFGKYNGRYYGLPFTYAPQILFYHKDIFEDRALADLYYLKHKIRLGPPKSFAQFNSLAEFFTKKFNPNSPTEYGTAIPAQYFECLLPELYMRLRSYGAEVFDKSCRVLINSPQAYKAYENLIQLIDMLPEEYLNLNDMNIVDKFLNKSIAMLITYPSFLAGINDIQRKSQLGKIGYTHIPGRSPILGGWSLGVSGKSKNKDSAFKFIHWATGVDIANYSAIMTGQSAILKTFGNSELMELYPWLPLYKECYDFAEPILPPTDKDGKTISQVEIDNVIFKELMRLIKKEIDIPAALKNTQNALGALI